MTPTTHDELRDVLAAHGLRVELAEYAVPGVALVSGGTGRSKLGGRPEIPGAWPINNGRGLTHLASIALDELPDVPVCASLPAEGTVVFFADLSYENEGWGPADGTSPVIEIVHVPAGAVAAAATPPDERREEGETPVVLNERRVRFEPVLTLASSYEVLEALALLDWLDPTVAVDSFFVALDTPDHLLLGEPAYIQEDPREPGELSLLQLNWDTELGLRCGDAGQISFYGRSEDLRMGRWRRVKATPDSC